MTYLGSDMKSALIIPTLNEIVGMKKIIPLIRKEWVDEIIIVDGGSTDKQQKANIGLQYMMDLNTPMQIC